MMTIKMERVEMMGLVKIQIKGIRTQGSLTQGSLTQGNLTQGLHQIHQIDLSKKMILPTRCPQVHQMKLTLMKIKEITQITITITHMVCQTSWMHKEE